MESTSVQDYLQMIYRLQGSEPRVSTTALAESLHVAPASVTGMVRKLHREGMAEHVPYRGVSLTEAGEREALRVLRRHRLWEVFLHDVLGLPWHEVHAEAHRLEHATSDQVADRLAAFLNEPQADPHGQPIPTRNGQVPARESWPLVEAAAGSQVRIVEVPDGDPAVLRRLRALGIGPGRIARIATARTAAGMPVLEIDGDERPIPPDLARRILVTHLDDS